jgi:ABC-type uncharacterized transport system YnjBCD permease subunit
MIGFEVPPPSTMSVPSPDWLCARQTGPAHKAAQPAMIAEIFVAAIFLRMFKLQSMIRRPFNTEHATGRSVVLFTPMP